MSILNKYKKWRDIIHLLLDKYLDFVLSEDNTPSVPVNGKMVEKCLSVYIDASLPECIEEKGVVSVKDYAYDACINDGATLLDIGFTGIDNGLITYEVGNISNKDFYNIFTKSKIVIPKDDCRLHLNAVSGNSGEYVYNYRYVDDSETESPYYELKGGFFQGFYKLHGFDYQVLPLYIEDEWNVEITIRPKDYETNRLILNNTHEDTDGFIFYMGTRAENKFLRVYNCDYSDYPNRHDEYDYKDKASLMAEQYFLPDDYYDPYENEPLSFYEDKYCNYLEQIYGDDVCDGKPDKLAINKKCLSIAEFFTNMYNDPYPSLCGCDNISKKKSSDDCSSYAKEKNYFADDSLSDDENNKGYAVTCDDYLDSMDLSKVTLQTSNNRPINERGYYEISTDNKFLTYDRTCSGLKAPDKGEDVEYIYTGITHNFRENPFLLFNRTCTGYTTHNIDLYYATEDKYDFLPDLKGNCFGIRVRKDGSIGYRYFMKNCDGENGYTIEEEYSFPNIVKKDVWNTINIKFKIINGSTDECGIPYGQRKMKIYIYVDGYLKMISKELNEFNFRALDDIPEKQEGVPFNISVGGGTQGLCDSIWLDYYTAFEKKLPIETYFAGSFIGDIRTFRFYTCDLEFNEIKNNYLHNRVII